MKEHRFSRGTATHVTADRSDGAGRRPRGTKPIAEGGTRPHLGTCAACGASVIHHKLANSVPTMLDPEELEHGADGARFVIIFGFVCPDPQPGAVAGLPWYRMHACPKAAEAR